MITEKSDNVLINYLLQSFSGYALCCILPTSCPSQVSRKRQRSLYFDIFVSLAEWPLLIFGQVLHIYLLTLDSCITLTVIGVQIVIVKLMAIISYGAENNENTSNANKRHDSKKRKLNKENETKAQGDSKNANNDDDGDGKKSKRRKLDKHDGTGCGPCSVWLQLGCPPVFADLHSSQRMFHPNENAGDFSRYLSTNGKEIILRGDSCLCQACYQDAHKNANKGNKREPRWVSVHKKGNNTRKSATLFSMS